MADVVGKLEAWQGGAVAWERQRVGEAMHSGATLANAEQRKFRRGIILMRAAILRHDLSKVTREANGYNNATLAAHFGRVTSECVNHRDVVAPWADRAKIEHENQRRAESLKKAVKDWDKVSEDVLLARLSPTNQGHYRTIQAEKARAAALVSPVVVYVPVPDEEDSSMAKTISTVSQGGHIMSRGDGGIGARLGGGGELYIVGHGNFGSSIGTHDESLGARNLVEALGTDGMPKTPTAPVWVYLFACWTGTHTRRAYGGIGKREPYARRFAKALADQGFSSYYVVGFAGAVEKDHVAQDYDMRKRGIAAATQFRKEAFENYVAYTVGDHDFNRVAGQDWTTKATLVEGIATSTITVRPRGGAHNE